MSITIKTILDSCVDKSNGGGEVVTHYEFATGPRNLMKAIETMGEHRKRMTSSYGNIGCGVTWLEIDGTIFDQYSLGMVMRDDSFMLTAEERRWTTIKSRTAKAKELLASHAAFQQRKAHMQAKMKHPS